MINHARSLLAGVLIAGCKAKEPAPAPPPPPPPLAVIADAATAAPPKPVQIDFTSANPTGTHVAGYPIDFAGDWQALHAKLKTEAQRLAQPTGNNPTPSGKLTLHIYQARASVPDLTKLTDDAIPDRDLIALYDNTLTGAWRFCFGGLRGPATMRKCIADTAPATATLYAPDAVEPE